MRNMHIIHEKKIRKSCHSYQIRWYMIRRMNYPDKTHMSIYEREWYDEYTQTTLQENVERYDELAHYHGVHAVQYGLGTCYYSLFGY